MSISSTDGRQLAEDGAYVAISDSTVVATSPDGTVTKLQLDSPVVSVRMTSKSDGCALTWDGKDAYLVSIVSGVPTIGDSEAVGSVTGGWVSVTDRGCFAAVNFAPGMDSNGFTFGDDVAPVSVVPGPFTLQGQVGIILGGPLHSRVSETRDGGATWAPQTMPDELNGARFGLATISSDDIAIPFQLSPDDKTTSSGVAIQHGGGAWTVEWSNATADVNGFVFDTVSSGTITAIATSGAAGFTFDLADDRFGAGESIVLPDGSVLLDVFTVDHNVAAYVTLSGECDSQDSCTQTMTTWRIDKTGQPAQIGTQTSSS